MEQLKNLERKVLGLSLAVESILKNQLLLIDGQQFINESLLEFGAQIKNLTEAIARDRASK